MRTRNVIKGKVNWFTNSRASNFASGNDAVRVLIETKLKTLKGEIWTNRNLGIPYFKKIDKETLDMYIRNEINSILEVQEILEINSEMNGELYNARIKVLANNQEVVVEI